MEIHDIIKKSRNSEQFSREEVVAMLALPADSLNSYVLMGEAARISREVSANRAEIHAQLALNLAPCPKDCLFCSFAVENGIFSTSTVASPEDAVRQARQLESDGANALYIMAIATFDIGQYLEMSKETGGASARKRCSSPTLGMTTPAAPGSWPMPDFGVSTTRSGCGREQTLPSARPAGSKASGCFRRLACR